MKTQGPVRAPYEDRSWGSGRFRPIFAQVAASRARTFGRLRVSAFEARDKSIPNPKLVRLVGPRKRCRDKPASQSVSQPFYSEHLEIPSIHRVGGPRLVPSRWKRHQELAQPLKRNRNK